MGRRKGRHSRGLVHPRTSIGGGARWLAVHEVDDALIRAPAVPGILLPGKIVEGVKAAGVYEGAAPLY